MRVMASPDSRQKSADQVMPFSQLLTINPLNRLLKAGSNAAGESSMAKVIKLELKRNGKARPSAVLNGTAEILIFNGVRVERLEPKKQSRKRAATGNQPRKTAV